MNDWIKTGAVLGAAILLTLVAFLTGPREVTLDLFSDQGDLFFTALTERAEKEDVAQLVAELQVSEFREATTEVYQFAVKRDDKGRWTIPSHGNYPADAKDRMAKAAAMLIGLKKDANISDGKGRHVEFGVVDPMEPGTDTAGRGKRITLRDSATNVLADLIVGKEIEGKLGVHYVRIPDKNRVYRTKVDGELSTNFADWIETDLLKAQAWDIDEITFDNYTVDEQRGDVVKGEVLLVKKDAAGKWQLDGMDAEKEEPNEDKLREISETLGQIKIVGVRPKPEGLNAMLEQATGMDRQLLAQFLAEKGFFLARGGKLYSNEGDLLFETKKGVRYTLRFGELVSGDGDELTSGAAPKTAAPKEGEPAAAKPANNRFLMVTAEFVESLLKKPSGARLPQEELDKRAAARTQVEAIQRAVAAFREKNENKLPESLQKLTEKPAEGEALLAELKKDPWDNDYVLLPEGDDFVVASYGSDKQAGGEGAAVDVRSNLLAYEEGLKREAGEWTEFDKKVEEGRKEADKLIKRFGPWYYVIDQALFAKLKPTRKDLVKAKAAEPANATAEPNK